RDRVNRCPDSEISLAYAISVISNQAGIICEVANPEYLICRGLCPLRDRATSLSPKKAEVIVDLPGLPPVQTVEDKILNEIWQFAGKTRNLYNASRFDELEALASQLRAEHGRFGNGSWKLRHFYEALRCRKEEPDSMWQLHETIHKNWDAAKPRSITAHIAHADFLIEYAWHARGNKFADKV